jgi:hypothetical protein
MTGLMWFGRVLRAGHPAVERMTLFAAASLAAFLGLGAAAAMGGPTHTLVDAHAYWSAWHAGLLYPEGASLLRAGYVYPPPLAQVLWLPSHLPWNAFAMCWSVAAAATYLWLLRPIALPLRVPLVVALAAWASDNLYWMMTATAVLGLRFPLLWTVPSLTKITSGVGVVWFAVRRQWREFLTAIIAIGSVASISIAMDPAAWLRWVDIFVATATWTGQLGTAIRLPVAPRLLASLILLAWGARQGRRWVVPIAMMVSLPDYWISSLGLLAAVPRLLSDPAAEPPTQQAEA